MLTFYVVLAERDRRPFLRQVFPGCITLKILGLGIVSTKSALNSGRPGNCAAVGGNNIPQAKIIFF